MRIGKTAVAAAGGAALLVAGMQIPAAQANDIAPLKTVFATDVAYAGLGGVRGLGEGTVALSGVTGSVTEALLFWHGPTNSEDPNANANVSFAGQPITGANIGTSSSNCWDVFANSQAYRADVTSLVAGNGDYAVADLTKEDADINGVELVVFFDDGNDANDRDVVLFEGNDSNAENSFDALGWNVSLPGINYASGSASMDMIVSDGQDFDDGSLELNGTTLDAGPELFQGDTTPTAGSDNEGSLWDQRQFDITPFLTPGANNIALTHESVSDCLSLVLAAVNLPAGAAPDQPTTTTTTEAPTTTTTAPPVTAPPTTTVIVVAAKPVAATPHFTG